MMRNSNKSNEQVLEEINHLDKILTGQKELLIVVHNNPDPDAMATAMALGYFAQKRYKIKSSIAYGGIIGRAENQAMVRKLKIRMKQIHRIHFDRYDRIALVDTQPGSGNHSLPPAVGCHMVIDHHQHRHFYKVDLVVIEPNIGAAATILVEWLKQGQIDIPPDLATALAYAIGSETQNLGREATQRDVQAYLSVYVKSNIRKLAQIIRPKLPHSYYKILAVTLKHAVTYRNLICAHLGEVSAPEMVAEMADFLLRHRQISWAFCTGRYKKNLILSLRSSNRQARAGKIIGYLVSNPQNVGGHGMIAGGYIPLETRKPEDLGNLEKKLSKSFATLMGYDTVDWHPLVEC